MKYMKANQPKHAALCYMTQHIHKYLCQQMYDFILHMIFKHVIHFLALLNMLMLMDS
ncbi:hypothetical protein KFK09_017907 [Dendrobium nobile]|uniref:Uncharacterized protein n=1 Tax=Dendrobium nobile TaxID=94219 RepID=A0A8T3ATR4_DENNO|nr:hypothetical protein KFK09_017907 [Dendrobium nobile]